MENGATGRRHWTEIASQPKLLAVVASMLVLAAFAVLRLGDGNGDVRVATDRTTTTASSDDRDAGGSEGDSGEDGDLTPDTTIDLGATSSTSSSSTSTTSTTAATSTTSTTVCRNSTDPVCGPFRWDPEPTPDQPIVVTVGTSAAQAIVGQPFTFTVKAVDMDAQPVFCEVYDLGDGTTKGTIGTPCEAGGPEVKPCETNRFGPWSPPTKKGGTFEYNLTHTYATAGTYTVRFFSYSEDGGRCHPYGSKKTTEVQVTVAAAS